jgi:DNA (cytosine-5)-methyltransferase 3A
MMGEKWEKVLSKAIGVNPIEINSALVSAQNRRRLYWTNIGMKPSGLFGDLESIIQQPKDQGILLKDILQSEVDEKYFLSEKLINGFLEHNKRHIEEKNQTGFNWKPTDGNKKANTLRANAALCPTDNSVIVHNTMPRSSTTGKGGTGHLSRNDGKTYCLDTGNTNAVEIVAMDFRTDEGLRIRNEGKTPTLCINTPVYTNTPRIRRLTPTECERLQTVKDGYTEGVSDTQRYRMLGNGWTIEVIKHIFSYLNNN